MSSTTVDPTVGPAVDPAVDLPQPSAATVLARTCRAEWSRLWTVRSTWWFALATAVTVLGLGLVLGIDVSDAPPDELPEGTAWRGGSITSTFGLYGLLALCAVAATADHATGGIVPTLQATPRRHVLVVARTVVVVAFATLFGSLVVAGSSVIVLGFAPEMGLPVDVGADFLADVAYVYAASTLLAVGTGLLVRNTAGSLVAVLGAMLVLPLMLALLPFQWAVDAAGLLPGTGAMRLLAGEAPVPLSATAAGVTLGVWAAVAVVAGAVRLVRSDADR
ncbi:hypothetical protein SFC79_00430 [Nocardioides sp. S-58]|uniref:ABC transporter permease n=1 Tax=Nocardioides renjunii TaxID=3095075 RepID=A0ABU5K5V8_9ACTN|nr:hypothetical protein [Nocardioides sp. S-58]MDZ5660214.1 hypothetical protein [Nocardioides sp. S-58]